jgi:hypothetical protein
MPDSLQGVAGPVAGAGKAAEDSDDQTIIMEAGARARKGNLLQRTHESAVHHRDRQVRLL